MHYEYNRQTKYMIRKRRQRNRRLKKIQYFITFLFMTAIFIKGGSMFINMVQANPKTDDFQYIKAEPLDDTVIEQNNENIDKSAWNLMLVNKWNKLPDDFSVELASLASGHSIDKRAYTDLKKMMEDAKAQGLSPVICSSFRTQQKQQSLFDNQVAEYMAQGYSKEQAFTEASQWVAIPRTSEHEMGLAVDIVSESYQILDEKQEETPEQKWFMENSYQYGFILRYPSDKSHITAINYEPWHYRYVGKKAAEEIYKKGICLEEYLGD